MVRRAFSDPSIGSITTRTLDEPLPKLTVPREVVTVAVKRLELFEDGVLAEAVDDEGAVTSLTDALVDRPGLDPPVLVEDPPMRRDRPAERLDPLAVGDH